MNTYKKVLPPLLLIFINYIPVTFLYAQSKNDQALIDSLSKELPKAVNDSSRIEILYNLAFAAAPNNSKAALDYANQCNTLSKKNNWPKGIALSYLAFAKTYFEISNFTGSLQNSQAAYEIFKRLNDKEKMALSLKITANNYDQSGYYEKALESNYTALRLYEEINNRQGISRAYNSIGSNYYYLLDYTRAIDNYNKALVTCRQSGDKYGIASAIDNIASVYKDEGKYDSADYYNLQAIRIFEEINHLPALGRIYCNRGNLMVKLYDAKSAYEFYTRAVAIDKRLGIKDELGSEYEDIGELYLTLAKGPLEKYKLFPGLRLSKTSLLEKARFYFAQSLALGKKINDISLLMNNTYFTSETKELLGDYKEALAFHKEYSLYKDSIFNDDNRKKIAAMENERVAEVKDKEIQLLNKEKALETSEIKRQALVKKSILIAAAIAALLLILFTWAFNRRRKTLFDKQVMNVEMKALRAQMNPHFIFNSLQSINKYVIDNDKANASAYLSKFSNLMRLILENSREQSVSLEEELHALELYIQLEALRFQNRFTYSIETGSIDRENILVPPMLLQPFVENAILHGVQYKEAGFIKVIVNQEDGMIRYIVEDNGSGREDSGITNKEVEHKHKSLGIKIISERLNIINQLKKVKAAFHIFDLKDANNQPRGLRIELLLPLELAF